MSVATEKSLRERMDQVDLRIERACQSSGRKRPEVTLIAVTKKFSSSLMLEAYMVGLRHFGENYVQEFERKVEDLSEMREAQFHLIGHLQSNKTNAAAKLFQVIQTVDTPKLARRLDQSSGQMNKTIDVMLEVKLSGEDSKSGAAPDQLSGLIEEVRGCSHLRLGGLMTMPPWSADPEISRPYFRRLYALSREHNLPRLSMGMSHDFEAAIEEGATHIRVGTALFGPRVK